VISLKSYVLESEPNSPTTRGEADWSSAWPASSDRDKTTTIWAKVHWTCQRNIGRRIK